MYDPGDLRVYDPILTNFSVGYKDQNLYGERLFPIHRVNSQNGQYRVFDRSGWLRYHAHRAPLTVANEIAGRKWSQDTFSVQEYSLQSPVSDEEDEELNSPGTVGDATFGGALDIDPEADATELVTRSLLLTHEYTVSTSIRNVGNYVANHKVTLAGATQWSDYTGGTSSTSDPVTDLRTAIRRVRLDTGVWPNTVIIPFDAVGVIENHPRVVARYTYTSVFDRDAWRQILGLPEGVAENLNVFVVDSMENTADNIDATAVMTSFWGQDVWVGIVDPTESGKNVQTFGKTFARPYPSGETKPTDRWYEINRKATVVRVSYRWDIKIVNNLAGYLIKTAVAAVP